MDRKVLPLSGKEKNTIPQGIRFDVFRRDNFTCRYCGRSSPQVVLHCDHVKPRTKGGETSMENLVTACTDCNFGKRAKDDITAPESSQPIDGLVGLFGFTITRLAESEERDAPVNKQVNYQFKIIRSLRDSDSHLVQLYSWWFGEPTQVIPLKTDYLLSDECELYSTIDDWKYAFEQHERFQKFRDTRDEIREARLAETPAS